MQELQLPRASKRCNGAREGARITGLGYFWPTWVLLGIGWRELNGWRCCSYCYQQQQQAPEKDSHWIGQG